LWFIFGVSGLNAIQAVLFWHNPKFNAGPHRDVAAVVSVFCFLAVCAVMFFRLYVRRSPSKTR